MVARSLRFQVLERDGFLCQYCGRGAPEVQLEADHIHQKSKGGKDELSNLITSCFDYNRGKLVRLISRVPSGRPVSRVAPPRDQPLTGKLTEEEIAALNSPPAKRYLISDGRNLSLEIHPSGVKSWQYRYRLDGKQNRITLGHYPDLSLADARQERDRLAAVQPWLLTGNLSDKEIRALESTASRYLICDGRNLNLEIHPSGVKSWQYRCWLNGRQRRVGLGHYPVVSLHAAREERDRLAQIVASRKSESHIRSVLFAPPSKRVEKPKPAAIDPPAPYLSMASIQNRLTLSEATIWRLIRKGKFPRPVVPGGWLEAAISSWTHAVIQESRQQSQPSQAPNGEVA